MRGEQAIFNLEIKKKSGLSINPDIHHSKVFSSGNFNNIFSQQFRFGGLRLKIFFKVFGRYFTLRIWIRIREAKICWSNGSGSYTVHWLLTDKIKLKIITFARILLKWAVVKHDVVVVADDVAVAEKGA